jgi:LuxR family maltose regulon positive regulatory protein
LADECRRRVTLVCAPPGSGKTTLLATWYAEQTPGRASWVTVSPLGDTGLEHTLHRVGLLREHILVVDDAHHLREDELQAIFRLVDSPWANVDVVLSSRADPPFGTGRLRVEGRLGEIRGAALAFTPEEAQELLSTHGVRVRASDGRRLHARTEGWAAGLRLMACALERGASASRLVDDDAVAQAAVSDYLLSEVLDREPPKLRRFLLRTSVAERLTPELAVLLSGDPGGGAVLDTLHRRGVFVVALDGGWYRYHSLFGALLRARLRVEDPNLARDLHRRAAVWFRNRDMWAAAETHARTGEDWTLLADLLLRRWREGLLRGQIGAPVADGLPRAACTSSPTLRLLAAAGDPDTELPEEPPASLRDEHAVIARLRACLIGERPADPVPEPHRDGPVARIASLLDAELCLDDGDLEGVVQVTSHFAEAGSSWIDADAHALLALALAIQGRTNAARRMIAAVLRCASVQAGRGRIAADAAPVVTLLCDVQLGRRAADGLPLDSSAAAIRICAQAIAIAGTSSHGTAHSVDPSVAHQPLAQRVFVALGLLDVTDSSGAAVLVGGRVEKLVRAAGRALNAGASRSALADALAAADVADAHPRSTVEAWVLAAVASEQLGDTAGADAAAANALAMAEESDAWAPVVHHGPSVAAVVGRVAAGAGPQQGAAIHARSLLHTAPLPTFVEPLTDRERVVLRYLPAMMSNAEIAAAMHVSINTVKTHLKSLYRKLGVDRRRDAVQRARNLELL